MRVLCVSQNLPAETDPIALALAAVPGIEVLSATQQKHAARHPGLARMFLRKCDSAKFEKNYFGFIAQATRTAQDAASAFKMAAQGGFIPDIILSCSSNGAGFALRQAFPEAFIVCMADSKLCALRPRGSEIFEARRAIQQKQFCEAELAFMDFPCQAEELCGCEAEVIPPSVDTGFFSPCEMPQSSPEITLMAGALQQNALEGTWKFCLALLREDPDIRIRVLAENSLNDFRWFDNIDALPGDEARRIRPVYKPSLEEWRNMLRECGAVVCLSSDVASCRRLLEAMSCAKAVLVAENTLPFVKTGGNCLPLPRKGAVEFALETAKMINPHPQIGARAREDVLAGHDQEKIVPKILERISREHEKWRRRKT